MVVTMGSCQTLLYTHCTAAAAPREAFIGDHSLVRHSLALSQTTGWLLLLLLWLL